MDIGLREWLIIGGILVIGLIIFDGWRRMKGHRSTLKMDIDQKFSDIGDDDHNPELPNGGARVKTLEELQREAAYANNSVNEQAQASSAARIDPSFEHMDEIALSDRHAEIIDTHYSEVDVTSAHYGGGDVSANPAEELDPLFDEIPDSLSPVRVAVPTGSIEAEEALAVHPPQQADVVLSSPEPEPEPEPSREHDFSDSQVAHASSLDLEQPITALMRQVSAQAALREDSRKQAQQEMFSEPQASPEPEAKFEPEPVEVISEPVEEPQETLVDRFENEPQALPDTHITEIPVKQKEDIPEQPEQNSLFDEVSLEQARTDRKARESVPEPEEVLVITVVGKQQPLDGQALLQVVLACGLRHGDMNLFHRFEEGIDKGAVQFSMANAVNPGTFDLERMNELSTPGVSFFMSMSEPKDPKNAFECMLATAETVAKHLGGDLLDENRSVMRPQTKAHYRERITEYEMHNRSRRHH
ncbi:cell division protein ZipA [Neptunomonas concharum]|uniref:Cell division protein ZipA n=1 Tax=Neptunomonas concharum TaxID=1031538 RepID=A0A5P1R955_9GAMM|nr:cell division protein ZipA [Neptunomonas concharum]QEQ95831.1 cell division protein ZipA [Neptunomonas concharum]